MAIELEKTAAAVPVTETDHAGPPRVRGPELEPSSRLGHFLIEKKLGAGGMGEVYLATDLALDRSVAIKVLPGGAAAGPGRDRLVREARAQARVHHPNVGHIYFIGEDDGRLYFAMEYVTGKTLADKVAAGPLPVEEALAVVHDAVLGLREAQRSGFTHRDVKPSNLMVDGHGVVKVLDFGLAASAPATDDNSPTTSPAATTLGGTPLYMAPEQARGERVDFRADIYALGATLYELVTGKPPYRADSFDQLISLHATADRPVVPRGVLTRTQSTALDALIAKMMAPQPQDRFASYDELLRAIENASTRYTRPAGIVVRTFAIGVDLLAVAIVVAVGTTLFSEGNVQMGAVGMPLLALLHWGLVARFGTTLGGALFEIEIVDARTGHRPSWQTAGLRSLYAYGFLILLAWLDVITAELAVPDITDEIIEVLYGSTIALKAIRLLYASLRVPGKRAPWDRLAGTIVRYRSGAR